MRLQLALSSEKDSEFKYLTITLGKVKDMPNSSNNQYVNDYTT